MKPSSLTVLLVVGFGLTQASKGGDLNAPAGPVMPTMKTPVEVEPRIAINAVNTPADANATFNIAVNGSYYLTGDVIGEAGKAARGNAVQYSIVAGNADAEVLSPGAAFVATNPWANFAY